MVMFLGLRPVQNLMNAGEPLLLSLLIFIILSFAISSAFELAYGDMLITPSELHKNYPTVITISGSVNNDDDISKILVAVRFPDGMIQNHNASVGKNNFVYFLDPQVEYPVGTYVVSVGLIDASDIIPVGTGAFAIYDEDHSFHFEINRGASTKSCDGCIAPSQITVYENSVLRWHNDDSAIHDIWFDGITSQEFAGDLLPDEYKFMLAADAGSFDYYCTIHPWMHGTITVIENEFDFPERPIPVRQEIPETAGNMEPEMKDNPIENKTLSTTPPFDISEPVQLPPISCDSCFEGLVTKVVDGDTLDIDGKRIRLALVDTPERGDVGYTLATDHAKTMCPVGSVAWYDLDVKQPIGPFGRIIAEVFCDGESLNRQIIDKKLGVINVRYCDFSDFASSTWAAASCMPFHIDSKPGISDAVEQTVSEVVDDIVMDDAVTDGAFGNITNMPSDAVSSLVAMHDDANPFDSADVSVTLGQIVSIVLFGIVVAILIKIRKRS